MSAFGGEAATPCPPASTNLPPTIVGGRLVAMGSAPIFTPPSTDADRWLAPVLRLAKVALTRTHWGSIPASRASSCHLVKSAVTKAAVSSLGA